MTLSNFVKRITGSKSVCSMIYSQKPVRCTKSCSICSSSASLFRRSITSFDRGKNKDPLKPQEKKDPGLSILTNRHGNKRSEHFPHKDKKSAVTATRRLVDAQHLTSSTSPMKIPLNPQQHQSVRNTTVSACAKAISNLMERRNALPAPTSWIDYEEATKFFSYGSSSRVTTPPYSTQDIQERFKLYEQVLILLQAIKLSIKTGRIIAQSGEDNQNLSMILGRCLLLCCEAPPSHFISPYAPNITLSETPTDASMDIINTLRLLNLNIQPDHYSAAIRAACQDRRFKEAATLFLHQIDLDNEGYIPIDCQLGWDAPLEMGLYAIAMSAMKDSNSDQSRKDVAFVATQQIFEAIENMRLVSSQDQDKYVIAAGSALGRAGLWEGIVLFHDSAEYRAKFGQPLVAASMYASILAGQYEIAVFLYYALLKDMKLGADWQWEGQYNGIHPLCKELFLRSVGKFTIDTDDDRYAEDALVVFNDIVSNRGKFSPTSLYGLFLTLQQSGKDVFSLNILKKIINHNTSDNKSWNIVDENAMNFLQNIDNAMKTINGVDAVNGKIVASVMTAFTQKRQVGLALLIGRLISGAKFNRQSQLQNISFTSLDEAVSRSDLHVATLVSSDISLWKDDEYRGVVVECLQHLHCHGVLEGLKEVLQDHLIQPVASNDTPVASTNISWLEAYSHIHYLSQILEALSVGNVSLTRLQIYHILKTLARMMECCTDAGQPLAGIHLSELFALYFKDLKTKECQPSLLSLITDSIFGKDDVNENSSSTEKELAMISLASSSDALLFATVRAYEIANGVDSALEFYFAHLATNKETEATDTLSKGPKQIFQINTANYVLSLLSKHGRIDDATSFLKRIPEGERNQETYSTIAQMYANVGKWNEVALLYNNAIEKSLLTESLGLLAMKGIERSVMDGKVRALRAIASDLAALTGEQPDKWIAARYWTLKKFVGFHYARLLMWWRNPDSTKQNELTLAIRYLKDHKLRGTPMNDDALRVIIKFIADKYNRSQSESDRQFAVQIILDSLLVAQNTSLMNDSNFISEAANSLQQLNELDESYNLVANAVDRGVEVDSSIVGKFVALRS